jgi:uncharacterized protein
MSAATNRQLIADAFAARTVRNRSFFDLLADDVDWTITGSCPVSGQWRSRRAFIEEAVRPLHDRLSGPVIPNVRALHADGDWVIVRWDGQATARDGRPYNNTYSWHLRIADGKVVEGVVFLDGLLVVDLFERVPRQRADDELARP